MLAAGRGDAQVIVLGEAAAVQHVGPGEAEGGHYRRAAVLHLLAERVAGLDGLVEVVDADGREEGAEELARVRVALLLHQRDPGARLLQHLLHGFVAQQVGQPHVGVLDPPAQEQGGGDGLAVGALVGELGLAEEEEPAGRAQARRGQEDQAQDKVASVHLGGRRVRAGLPAGEEGATKGCNGSKGWRQECAASRRLHAASLFPSTPAFLPLGNRRTRTAHSAMHTSGLLHFFMQIERGFGEGEGAGPSHNKSARIGRLVLGGEFPRRVSSLARKLSKRGPRTFCRETASVGC